MLAGRVISGSIQGWSMRIFNMVCIATVGVLLAGCQTTTGKDKRDALAASGFALKTANNKAQADLLAALPPFEMATLTVKNKQFYVMPGDPKCSCAYVGNPQQFAQYKSIRVQQKIAEEQLAAAQINQAAAFDFDAGWGPYYGDPFFN